MEKSLVRQYIVDEKGNPTAVILSIENFRKILSILDDVENSKENIALSQSPEFVRLMQKGLEDVRLNRVSPWKDVWDELCRRSRFIQRGRCRFTGF